MALPGQSQHDSCPDPQSYLNDVQKYFFRPIVQRSLRVGQFFRYCYFGDNENGATQSSRRTDKNTQRREENAAAPDDQDHRHYHAVAYEYYPGERVVNE